MILNEHGEFTSRIISDNIILTDAIGAWNFQSLLSFQKTIRPLIESFNGQHWKHISVLRGETLFIPEVEKEIIKYLFWSKSKNQIRDTYILKYSNSAALSKMQLEKIFKIVNTPIYFADSVEEALNK